MTPTYGKQLVTVLVGAVGGWFLSASMTLAATILAPSMMVQIGNEIIPFQNVEWNFDAAKNSFTLANSVIARASNGSTFSVSMGAQVTPDSVQKFEIGASNVTFAPLAYSFVLNTPLSPNLQGPVDSYAWLGIGLIDEFNNGARIEPTGLGGKILTSSYLFADGAGLSRNVDLGDPFSFNEDPGNPTRLFSADGSLDCHQACVTMSSFIGFTLTGNDDFTYMSVTTGIAPEVPAVPLPGAAWLFLSSLSGLAFVRKCLAA